MQNQTKNMLMIGFMMFSTFFGAGNLIFPPYLGMLSGSQWYIGFFGFLIGDVTLAILAIIATCKFEDANRGVLTRGGYHFATVISSIMILCVGPFVCIPRTASTVYEISIQPNFPQIPTLLFSVLFFIVVFILAVRPTKVVDYVGKILTPALLFVLACMIIKGFIAPIGNFAPMPKIETVFAEGLMQGYQTLDAMGGTVVAILVMATIVEKGYGEKNARVKIATQSGIVAGFALMIVYGGLCFFGGTVSQQYDASIAQTTLLVGITKSLFGHIGQVVLAIIVTLACLTTAVGLTSSTAQYFSSMTNNKLKYSWIVAVVCIFSTIVSKFGVTTIVNFSVPILNLLYPTVVTMIVLSTFTDYIKNDNIFKCAAYMAVLMGFLDMLKFSFISYLPLSKFGFAWVVPVIIAGVIGLLIPNKKNSI